MRDRFLQAVAAGHTDDHLGLGSSQFLGRDHPRSCPHLSEYVNPSGGVDLLRDPVSGHHQGVEPLEADHPGTLPASDDTPDRVEARPESSDQLGGSLWGAGHVADVADGAEHGRQAVGLERYHRGLAWEQLGGLEDLGVGDSADLAQLLGEDQVGMGPP